MQNFSLTYKQFGEQAILIEWPSLISEEILFDVLSFQGLIKTQLNNELIYINSAYNSILLRYKNSFNLDEEIFRLNNLYNNRVELKRPEHRLWKIPVCYHPEFGIDLKALTEEKNITVGELIHLHSSIEYRVYFTGFLPGFLYLGGLPERLHSPRRAQPRQKILKGAVAIGGEQTGIYPMESPGGWNIIGISPVELFNVNKEEPCNIKAGDKVKFNSIDLKEYSEIQKSVSNGDYQLINEIIYD